MRGAFDIAYDWDSADALLAGPLASTLSDLTEARALAQRSGEERDRAVAVLKGLLSDVSPIYPADWYEPPGNASVAAATRFLADRELALRAARSVIEHSEGEDV
jgi:hypothetical protein